MLSVEVAYKGSAADKELAGKMFQALSITGRFMAAAALAERETGVRAMPVYRCRGSYIIFPEPAQCPPAGTSRRLSQNHRRWARALD